VTQSSQPPNLHEQQCRRLIEQMPWLATYDHEFLMQLIRAGIMKPEDLWRLYSPAFASSSAHTQEPDVQPLRQAEPQSPTQASPATMPPEMLHDYPLEFVLEQIGDTNTRLLNILRRNGIKTVGQLLMFSDERFALIHSVGTAAVSQFRVLKQKVRAWHQQNRRDLAALDSLDYPLGPTMRWLEIDSDYLSLGMLRRAGVRTVGQLLKLSEAQFARVRGVGGHKMRVFRQLKEHLQRRFIQAGFNADLRLRRSGNAEVEQLTERDPCQDESIDAEVALQEQTAPDQSQPAELPVHDWALEAAYVQYGELSTRACNTLRRLSIHTVGQLLQLDEEQLWQTRHCGAKTVKEICGLQRRIMRDLHCPERYEKMRAAYDRANKDSDEQLPGDDAHLDSVSSLAELLENLIESVSSGIGYASHAQRNADIWRRRHGLAGDGANTLQEIAEHHDLTRERIRQIADRMSTRMYAQLSGAYIYQRYLQALEAALRRCLGKAEVGDFARVLSAEAGWEQVPTQAELQALAKIIKPNRLLRFECEKRRAATIVGGQAACPVLWEQVLRLSRSLLAEVEERRHLLDFAYELRKLVADEHCCERESGKPEVFCAAEGEQVELPDEYIRAALLSLDPVPLEGEWVQGLVRSTLEQATQRRQVVRAALERIGRPVHYREVARFIRDHNEALAEIADRNVHACLTYYDEFVPTGERGMYGLEEWGIERYQTTADRVEELLRSHQRPLDIRRIIELLGNEGVPENNIRACLDQMRFVLPGDGTVILSEWDSQAGDEEESVEQDMRLHIYDDDFGLRFE
jgi:DNA-directed RNA polymerase alpha subunit